MKIKYLHDITSVQSKEYIPPVLLRVQGGCFAVIGVQLNVANPAHLARINHFSGNLVDFKYWYIKKEGESELYLDGTLKVYKLILPFLSLKNFSGKI